MRNASHGQSLPPLPFDELAGLEVTEPRNLFEAYLAWREYQRLDRHPDTTEEPTP